MKKLALLLCAALSFALSFDAAPAVRGQTGTVKLQTAVSASGTSVDFNNIPAGVKRITVTFSNISTATGGTGLRIQVGSVGSGVETASYFSTSIDTTNGVATAGVTDLNGFIVTGTFPSNANSMIGVAVLDLHNSTTNVWVFRSHTIYSGTTTIYSSAGQKTMSGGRLDRVRFTTVSGADTFDQGTVNVSYEF